MTLREKRIEFAIFCIEGVAERLGELPERIYDKLRTLGLLDEFIFDCYESLHIQSKEQIVDDVIEAIHTKEKKDKV